MRARTFSVLGVSSRLMWKLRVVVSFFLSLLTTTTTSKLSVFGGGQLIWKLGVVVGKRKIQKTTTTTSRLSQGLGRCFRGCAVVVVHQLQDDDKRCLQQNERSCVALIGKYST